VRVVEDHVGLAKRVGEGLRDAGAPAMWCTTQQDGLGEELGADLLRAGWRRRSGR
jgi:hypothetical protein